MRTFKLVISYLLMFAGIGLLVFANQRGKLPYNERGMYFDTENMIVYHQQTVEVIVFIGVVSIIVGFVIWAVTARI
ncbi:hypothetical protein [Pseudochryseolinea flava]|uniref:Uncharacterized protein n=1 Tax=Pseudochryseolinea flava TaxID=2059302 RepID=A0A364Y8X3_9BACT|nr:hypothetical protein [Pseudochryseolinea flava]RAW02819.1 hypothetical protein DQQ10_01545 [Pseudochryseolinea flava]